MSRAPSYILPRAPSVLLTRHKTHIAKRAQSTHAMCQAAGGKPTSVPHTPVLVREVLEHLPARVGTLVDCTVGAGGHAQAILRARGVAQYIGVDKDESALRMAHGILDCFSGVTLLKGDFRHIVDVVRGADVGAGGADAVLLDAGVSSMQLDDGRRGFSLTRDGPLDMRMDACGGVTAAQLVNGLEETQLANMLLAYGDERAGRRIAREVVSARPLESTCELADVVVRVKGWRKKGVHPATQTFQALRVAVNTELDALALGVEDGVQLLRPGGRMAVISFHSLEDRIVKRVFNRLADVPGGIRIITKKPIVPGLEEIAENCRCRSAKLRVVERVAEGVVGKQRKVNKYARSDAHVYT